MKKCLTLLLSAALAAGLLSCCAKENTTLEGMPTPPPSVVVNCGLSNPWDSLMPYNSPSGSNYSRIIYDKIYDRLAYVHADGTLSPRAAVSWESADGGMAVVFHLDRKAAFHDGTPVTARHWADTIALMTDPDCPTLGRSAFAVLAGTDGDGNARRGRALGAEAVDDYTLKLTFKAPTTPEDFLLDRNREYYVLPTHLLEGVAPEDVMAQELWYRPVGSGPCKFSYEVAGSQLVLEANKDYQLGAPGFDKLSITVMDKSNLLTALIAGDLDYYAFGGSVSAEDSKAAQAAGLTVIKGTVPTTFFELMLNGQSIPDARVRRAIEAALDKELLCEQSAPGLAVPTDTSVLPGSPSYPYGADAAARPRDLEGAKALLSEAGYAGTTYKLACTSNRAGLAALIQQNLNEAGISTAIETVDSATLFSGMVDGTYDMAIASHTPSALPLWFVDSRFTRNNNIFHVGDLSGYESEIAAVKEEADPAARRALVAALDAHLMEERPFIPLWFSRALHVQSPTVEGIDYASSSFSNENVWAWKK